MAGAWRTVAEMQARDLLRRRAAVLLLVGLPMSWYAAEVAAGIDYAVGTGVLAMAWSAAAASLFAFVGARHVDQRLVLTGHRPRDIVLGRLVALLALTGTVALAVGAVMVAGSRPNRPGDVFLALALTTLVSTAVGWLTAAVVPRELEGTLLLIGLVGLQVSIPVSGIADVAIPYYGPLRLTDYEQSPIGPGGPTLHSLTWSFLIALAALALWRRRTAVDASPYRRTADSCQAAGRRTRHARERAREQLGRRARHAHPEPTNRSVAAIEAHQRSVVSSGSTSRTQHGHIRNDTRDVSRRIPNRPNGPDLQEKLGRG